MDSARSVGSGRVRRAHQVAEHELGDAPGHAGQPTVKVRSKAGRHLLCGPNKL